MARRLERLEAIGPAEMRKAYGVLQPIIRELPDAEHLLLGKEASGALRTLRDHDPEIYLAYRAAIRQRCGRHLVDILDHAVGPPRTTRPREIILQSPADVHAKPAPAWLVRGILPATGIGVAYGEPGTGKSFFVVDLALAIARGERYRGRRTRAGGIVYLASEGQMRPRLEAYAQHYGVELEGLRIRVIEQSLSLRGPDSDLAALVEKLQLAREQLGGIALIVVDTLNRTLGGGNESASEDMGEYLASLGLIASSFDCLVLVIHHSGKNAALGARGHSSLRGAADVELEITRSDGGLRQAKIMKLRDGTDGEQLGFRLEAVDLGAHPDPEAEAGERWGSCIVVASDEHMPTKAKARPLPPGAQVALDALKTAIELHGEFMPKTSVIPGNVRVVNVSRWQQCFEAVRPIEQNPDPKEARRARQARRMAFQRAQEQLQAVKVVDIWEGFAWLP